MAILKTYDLKGQKLSFANWISNLSPVDTPFASMIGKESVDQTMYSWQTDRLSAPDITTEVKEGADFVSGILAPTSIHTNYTQILRKAVRVTDTANKVGLYGRDSEKAYQMEKAAKELKRDLEFAMLTQVAGAVGTKTTPRLFKGFPGLVAGTGQACPDTGAVVHKIHQYAANDQVFGEEQIFDITYNLYLAGSKANKIMIHPKHMVIFSQMINDNQTGHHVTRMFDGLDTKFNAFVKSIRDPLGQTFEIIPNRFMPLDKVYFFNEKDWTQMVLREPKSMELARQGSSERHMIEMEVGLRHSNPFASGILELVATGTDKTAIVVELSKSAVLADGNDGASMIISVLKNGVVDTAATGNITVTANPTSGVTFTPANPALSQGRATTTVKGSRAGNVVLKAQKAVGQDASVEILFHTRDRMMAPLSDESLEEAAPVVAKARKVKAKAE